MGRNPLAVLLNELIRYLNSRREVTLRKPLAINCYLLRWLQRVKKHIRNCKVTANYPITVKKQKEVRIHTSFSPVQSSVLSNKEAWKTLE